MKQTHRKVRSGCVVCRRRRIKCDELRPECTQCHRLRTNRGNSVHCQYESSATVPQTSVALPWDPLATSQYGWATPATNMEKRLLHHLCSIRKDFDVVQKQGLAAGVGQFSRFFELAKSVPYLRHCFYAFGAGHIRTLSQSAEMAAVEYYFRGLTMQGMIVSLSGERTPMEMKALRGATTIMAWYAREPREYGAFLKGIFALMHEDGHEDQKEDLATSDDNELALIPIHNNPDILGLVTDAVQALSKCELDDDIKIATQEIRNFLYNFQQFPWSASTSNEQFSAMFPLRNWVRWIPHAPERLRSQDFKLLLLVANYETVLLAMGLVIPTLNTPLALYERYHCNARFRASISSQSGIESESVARALSKWRLASNACTQRYAETLMAEHMIVGSDLHAEYV